MKIFQLMVKGGDSQFAFSRRDVEPSDFINITMKESGGFVILFDDGNSVSKKLKYN